MRRTSQTQIYYKVVTLQCQAKLKIDRVVLIVPERLVSSSKKPQISKEFQKQQDLTSNQSKFFTSLPKGSQNMGDAYGNSRFNETNQMSKSNIHMKSQSNINQNILLKDLGPTLDQQLKNQLSKYEHEFIMKQAALDKFKQEYDLIMKQKTQPFSPSTHQQKSRFLDSQYNNSKLFSSQSMKSLMLGSQNDISIHKGYDNFLNSQTVEQLEEKIEFLNAKFTELDDLELVETAESLKLELVLDRFKKQKLFDYQKYKHRVPEFRKIINMTDSMKQAYFLSQTSMITSVSGMTRCKENLIDIKIKNQEKIKLKHQELQHQESEVKAMKFMVTQKSNKYQEAKKQLEELKKKNKETNMDKMKQELYKIRLSEILHLIDAQLLCQLFRYFQQLEKKGRIIFDTKHIHQNSNMDLFELKIALELQQEEKSFYTKSYNFEQMSPEINTVVHEKLAIFNEFNDMTIDHMLKLSDFIEEKTIYNQSLQLKSKELTQDLSKRKYDVERLNTELRYAQYGLSLKDVETRNQNKYTQFQKQYTKEELVTLTLIIDEKKNQIENYREFSKQLKLRMTDIALKASAKLLKLREFLPFTIIHDHFPPQLMAILTTYQKISPKKMKLGSSNQLATIKIESMETNSRKRSDFSDNESLKHQNDKDEESEQEDSFLKKAKDDILILQKSANELKNRKRHKQLENQLNLKKRDDDEADMLFIKATNPKKAELQELWKKIEEQQKLLEQPLDTANTLKLSLQQALKKMVESWKFVLHLKIMVFQIDLNKADFEDKLKTDCNVQPTEQYEISQKNFNKHYDDVYNKLNYHRAKRQNKLTKAQTLTEFNDGQEYNENSFLKNQYEKEKEEYERKMKEKLHGKRKKKHKYNLKERKKIKFFNSLHKRGLNPDKVSDHQTNVKYTQVFKQISNYQKQENKFINRLVNDFENANNRISSASGAVYISKKFQQGNNDSQQNETQQPQKQETMNNVDTRKAVFRGNQNMNVNFSSAINSSTRPSGQRGSIRSQTQLISGKRIDTPKSLVSETDSEAFETKSEEERRDMRIKTLKSRFSTARGMSQIMQINPMDTMKLPNLSLQPIKEHKRGQSGAFSNFQNQISIQNQVTQNNNQTQLQNLQSLQVSSTSNTRNIPQTTKNQSWFAVSQHSRVFNFKVIRERQVSNNLTSSNSVANFSSTNSKTVNLINDEYRKFNPILQKNKPNQQQQKIVPINTYLNSRRTFSAQNKSINTERKDSTQHETQNQNQKEVQQIYFKDSKTLSKNMSQKQLESPTRSKMVLTADPQKRFQKISHIYEREIKTRAQPRIFL
eukprot:403374099